MTDFPQKPSCVSGSRQGAGSRQEDSVLFDTASPPFDPAALAASARRCLSSEDGRVLLDYLVATTLQRVVDPDADPDRAASALWYYEGQRALVLRLLRLSGPSSS